MAEPAEYNFQRYLAAKRTVDDRALNEGVWRAFLDRAAGTLLRDGELRILEVGCGVGTMLLRLLPSLNLRIAGYLEAGATGRTDLAISYLGLDSDPENIVEARRNLNRWRQDIAPGQSDILGVKVEFREGDALAFARTREAAGKFDVLIAQAFLDLVETRSALAVLFRTLKPGGVFYFPINFDGVTIFQPEEDPSLENLILEAYHATMDNRLTEGIPSGDSRTGRHLFGQLEENGAIIFAAGASDWVVFPDGRRYPNDEAYFLFHILHFIETSLEDDKGVPRSSLAAWLELRRRQIMRGKLVYIAHQMDFVGRVR